jgi:NitT/TauT family transport system substrate-binding protein
MIFGPIVGTRCAAAAICPRAALAIAAVSKIGSPAAVPRRRIDAMIKSDHMMAKIRIAVCWLFLAMLAWLAPNDAGAAPVRLALQKTGTVAWEFDVMRRHGLDKRAGLELETIEQASPEAGKIALRGGSADVIVSDWLWVSRERSLGFKLVFYPYSSALGAVMVPAKSSIGKLADLQGKSLAVAGGPLDKSWLLLQAAAAKEGVDLKAKARIVYGAPALLAAKMQQGEMDATLNYWNFCARLEAHGFRRLVGIGDLLPQFGVSPNLSMIGYVFSESFAKAHPRDIAAFLDVTHRAKQILMTSDAEWDSIAPLTGATDAATLKAYRDRYREGIPDRPVAAEEKDAAVLYRVLARLGGEALVGPAKELVPGTFYRPTGD